MNLNKVTTEYRDKINLKRNEILNQYAKNTSSKGTMYYIYDKHSEKENTYNICICEDDKSHIVVEKSQDELPYNAKIGSVLRNIGDEFIIDIEATNDLSYQINEMQNELLEEQNEILDSLRIENHVYELSEKDSDRVWLFDITSNGVETIEEIEFPEELIQESNEGDLFIFEDNKYKKLAK